MFDRRKAAVTAVLTAVLALSVLGMSARDQALSDEEITDSFGPQSLDSYVKLQWQLKHLRENSVECPPPRGREALLIRNLDGVDGNAVCMYLNNMGYGVVPQEAYGVVPPRIRKGKRND